MPPQPQSDSPGGRQHSPANQTNRPPWLLRMAWHQAVSGSGPTPPTLGTADHPLAVLHDALVTTAARLAGMDENAPSAALRRNGIGVALCRHSRPPPPAKPLAQPHAGIAMARSPTYVGHRRDTDQDVNDRQRSAQPNHCLPLLLTRLPSLSMERIDDRDWYTSTLGHTVPVLPRPRPDRLALLSATNVSRRGNPSWRHIAAASGFAAQTSGRIDEFSKIITQFASMMAVQVDFVGDTVQAESHRLDGVTAGAIQIVNKLHDGLLSHLINPICLIPQSDGAPRSNVPN